MRPVEPDIPEADPKDLPLPITEPEVPIDEVDDEDFEEDDEDDDEEFEYDDTPDSEDEDKDL